MQDTGKLLMMAGAALLVLGLALYLGPSIPWLGRLPGDVRVERPGFRLYAPIASCIVISIVLTVLLNLLSRFR